MYTEDDDDNSKYLKSCKAIEYVRIDGKPGLTLQHGHCRFWTPEVVRLEPELNVNCYVFVCV